MSSDPLPPLANSAPIDLELPDGLPVRLRPLTIDDAERAQAAYALLGDASKRNRFWQSGGAPLSLEAARHLTSTSDATHIAWAALPPDESAFPGYGAGSLWRSADSPEDAEFSMTVGDRWQRKGFGTLLFSILWFEGWRLGIRRIHAIARVDNRAMAAWWRGFGGEVTPGRNQQELHLDLEAPDAFRDRVHYDLHAPARAGDLAEWFGAWIERGKRPSRPA